MHPIDHTHRSAEQSSQASTEPTGYHHQLASVQPQEMPPEEIHTAQSSAPQATAMPPKEIVSQERETNQAKPTLASAFIKNIGPPPWGQMKKRTPNSRESCSQHLKSSSRQVDTSPKSTCRLDDFSQETRYTNMLFRVTPANFRCYSKQFTHTPGKEHRYSKHFLARVLCYSRVLSQPRSAAFSVTPGTLQRYRNGTPAGYSASKVHKSPQRTSRHQEQVAHKDTATPRYKPPQEHRAPQEPSPLQKNEPRQPSQE